MNPATLTVDFNRNVIEVTATAADTSTWARRPWPCSTLSGLEIAATLDCGGDLIDLNVFDPDSGGVITPGLDGAELTAFLDDQLYLTARVLLAARRALA